MAIPDADLAVANLMQWTHGKDWEDLAADVFAWHLGPVLQEAGIKESELFDRLGRLGESVSAFIIEDFLSAPFGADGKRVVDEYLAQHGESVEGPAREYLLALRNARPSLVEVVGVRRGQTLTVRDLLFTGDPITIQDTLASGTVALWDCFIVRIVRVRGVAHLTGSLLELSRDLAEMCIGHLREMASDFEEQLPRSRKKRKGEGRKAQALRSVLRSRPGAVFLSTAFIGGVLQRKNAPPPDLRNTDGETLVWSQVRFPIVGSETAVAERLDSFDDFDRDDEQNLHWIWVGRRWVDDGGEAVGDAGEGVRRLSLGEAQIAEGSLRLEANSVERAEQGRELLAVRLGLLLGSPLTSHEDAARRIGEESDWPSLQEVVGTSRRPAKAPPDVEIDADLIQKRREAPGEEPDEDRKREAARLSFVEAHYRRIIDEPLPVLGDVSPRRAAETRKGRARVQEWLKRLENFESKGALLLGRSLRQRVDVEGAGDSDTATARRVVAFRGRPNRATRSRRAAGVHQDRSRAQDRFIHVDQECRVRIRTAMIPRRVVPEIEAALGRQAAVALLGPRQAGKTTLAREIAGRRDAVFLDLELAEDRRRVADWPAFAVENEDRLVILDEIHSTPELFPELRGVIDQGRRTGKGIGRFLILGSVSLALLRQSESLAGRIAYVDLAPLDVLEIEPGPRTATALWVRGGLPLSHLAGSDEDSFLYRRDLIRAYLERDAPQFRPRVAAPTLERLWIMLAHGQGALLNLAKLAANLMVSARTVSAYLDLLIGLLLVRRLPPRHANVRKRLVRAPKVYVRDSGLVHALLGIRDHHALAAHPVVGMSWEGFVIETLLGAAPRFAQASFYRTSNGAEVDLVLDLPGRTRPWAIEIKRSAAPTVSRGFPLACEDLDAERTFVVHGGEHRYSLGRETEAIGLRELAALVRDP